MKLTGVDEHWASSALILPEVPGGLSTQPGLGGGV